MGRWVTSKGRRIYIPDPGEENPYAKRGDDISMRKSSSGMIWVAHKSQQGKKRGVRDLDRPFDNEEDAIKFADTIEGRAQEGRKPVDTSNATDAETHKDLESKLKEKGLSLESADSHTMQNSNSLNGEKVTMYDKDGNEYQGTYNKYSDGGREIVDIKKTKSSEKSSKKSQLDKDEEAKSKQIASNKAQADELNGKSDFSSPQAYAKSNNMSINEMANRVANNKKAAEHADKLLKSGYKYSEATALAYEAHKDVLQKASEAIISKEAAEGLKKLKKRKGSKK